MKITKNEMMEWLIRKSSKPDYLIARAILKELKLYDDDMIYDDNDTFEEELY